MKVYTMNSYERMKLILEGKKGEVDRIPCACPGIGTYTEELMNEFDAMWPESHREPEKMATLGAAAHEKYGLESVVVPFDAVVEAEILGMAVDFREKQLKKGKILWPGVLRPGFTKDGIEIKEPSDIVIPDDIANAGRVPAVTKALGILHEKYYGEVPICTYIMGPFTTMIGYVLDTIKFMMMVRTDPEKVKAFYRAVIDLPIELAKIYKEAGADIVAFREDGVCCDNVSPKDFLELFKGPITEVFEKSPINVLTMSGTAGPIMKDCAEVKAKMIVIDEKTDAVKAREDIDAAGTGVALAGNLPTMTLLKKKKNEDKIDEWVKKIIEEAHIDVVAPGCDFFVKTPGANIEAMIKATAKYGQIN
jgi:[methyl-Co(III) methanol-specific corrinoid protein]:coenzyme M methyltransferase